MISTICWCLVGFIVNLVSFYLGYVIGFKNGFIKSKEIDDKIIEELTEKYKQ